MEKMTWAQPEVKELDVKETALGSKHHTVPDASYTDDKDKVWYSYS